MCMGHSHVFHNLYHKMCWPGYLYVFERKNNTGVYFSEWNGGWHKPKSQVICKCVFLT